MEPVQPEASVVQTGLGVRYIGKEPMFAYAYSGEVINNNNTVTLLEFDSQAGFIVGTFSYGIDRNAALGGNKQIGFTISLNGIKMFQVISYTASTHGLLDFDNNYNLLVPPQTHVKIESETDEADNIPTYGMFTGRVYGANE